MEIVGQHYNYMYTCMGSITVHGCLTVVNSYLSHCCFALCTDNMLAIREILKITEFPTNGHQLTLFFGETAHLNCSGVVARKLTQYYWRRGNSTFVCSVREDPYCVPSNRSSCPALRNHNGGCQVDELGRRRCNGSRVYSYVYSSIENCTYGIQRKHATMIINGVTWSDGGAYTCLSTRGDDSRIMEVVVGEFVFVIVR